MNKVYVGIGISGSGKSTFFENFLEDAHYLNADSIREELCGDAKDQSKNGLVFGTLYERLLDVVNSTTLNDIVVDNTSLTVSDRNKIYSIVKSAGRQWDIILVVFQPNLDQSKVWNTRRERVVPEHVLEKQIAKFQPPTGQELEDYKVVTLALL